MCKTMWKTPKSVCLTAENAVENVESRKQDVFQRQFSANFPQKFKSIQFDMEMSNCIYKRISRKKKQPGTSRAVL